MLVFSYIELKSGYFVQIRIWMSLSVFLCHPRVDVLFWMVMYLPNMEVLHYPNLNDSERAC